MTFDLTSIEWLNRLTRLFRATQTRPIRTRFGTLAVLGLLAAVSTFSLPGTSTAQAQTLPPAVVAVIDYQRLMRESSAANAVREQVDVRRQSLQSEIAELEQQLVADKKTLDNQVTLLDPETRETKIKEFEAHFADVQRDVQRKRQLLDQVFANALNEVRNAIIEIAEVMAEERGFNVVLPSTDVLLFSPELDLTDDILAQLNDILPTVAVAQTNE